jgi:hypothetical protein
VNTLTPIKKLSSIFTFAAATFLAGCRPNIAVAPSDGHGHGMDGVQCTLSQVFKSAKAQKACIIDAASLQKGTTYHFSGGLLAVRGDVANGVSIEVTNGKLYIDGNVQNGANISAQVPEDWATDIILMPMPMRDGNGGTTIIMMPMPQSRFVSYRHANDDDPAVIIKGSVEKGARVSGNTGSIEHAGPTGFNVSPAVESTLALR